MKTLKRIMAVGLCIGFYHAGFAQSSQAPSSSSDVKKSVAKPANVEQSELQKKQAQVAANRSASAEQAKIDEANKAALAKKNQPIRSKATRSDVKNTNKKAVAPVRAANANLAAKRLPANYENSNNQTSKSEK